MDVFRFIDTSRKKQPTENDHQNCKDYRQSYQHGTGILPVKVKANRRDRKTHDREQAVERTFHKNHLRLSKKLEINAVFPINT
jgi:hypothetical protein